MRHRFVIVLLMLCLLPLQISWAVAADYCGHGKNESGQHFGHHNDEYKLVTGNADNDKQPTEESGYSHSYSHLSGLLGLLSAFAASPPTPSLQPSLRLDERPYPSISPPQPERPKWSVPA